MKHLHLTQMIIPLKDFIINYLFSCKISAIDLNLQKQHIFKVL